MSGDEHRLLAGLLLSAMPGRREGGVFFASVWRLFGVRGLVDLADCLVIVRVGGRREWLDVHS